MTRIHWIVVVTMVIASAGNRPAIAQNAGRARGRATQETVWVNPPGNQALPEGVTHATYVSPSMKHEVGYHIYLPPGYAKNPVTRYPVIYCLHGAGGDERSCLNSAEVLHQGIASGRWPEMILVMPNGGKFSLYIDSHDGRTMGETNIVKELIPHIDATYRTIAARHGRCIEGFSMGGRGSVKIAMKYPEMFCSLFNQAGNVFHVAPDFDDPNLAPAMRAAMGPDRQKYVDNDPYLLLEKNMDRIRGQLRIQMFCGTQDDHLPTIREFHEVLTKAGVDHTYMEIEALGHNRKQMIAQYAPIWYDYHVESLKQAAARAHKESAAPAPR